MIEPRGSAERSRPGRIGLIAVALVAAAGVFAAYAHTIGYGFRYDDYHVVRPWTWLELQRVLHGSWDPMRVEVPFYRPLTAWWYALRFHVFGLNAAPQHALSLAGMMFCATMVGLFVWREIDSRRAALVAALLYAIHPAMAYPQAVWLTNQMHLMASAFVLLALVAWQYARSRGPWAWLPVLVLQVLAFGTKEDTIMLTPLLVGLTIWRRVLVRDIRWPHWGVCLVALMLPFALFAFRYDVLGSIGGYGAWPGLERARENLLRASGVFTLQPVRRPWQWAAHMTSVTLLVAGGLASLRRREPVYLVGLGLAAVAAFNLPFALVTKVEQYHLVALGAVLTLAGAVEGLVRVTSIRIVQRATTALAVAAMLTFLPLTRHIARDFAPCSPITLETDGIALGWWMVPPEVQAWLRAKPAACQSGPPVALTTALSSAVWAFNPQPGDDGEPLQWTSRQAVVMARSDAKTVTLALRRPDASPASPVDVTIEGPGSRTVERITTGDWRQVVVQLTPTLASRLRDMHRVDLSVAQTFVPAQLDQRNDDKRRLGVQMRVVRVK